MYLLSIFGCFFNLIFILLFNRFLDKRTVFFFVILSLFISFSCALVMFYEVVMLRSVCFVPLFSWVKVSFLSVIWTLVFDSLSTTLLLIVLFISLLVHLYSLEYMYEDPHIIRFLFCLSLFTFFMLTMATANNVLQLFLGWEGVGLSSYLLINFWYSRSEANKSAIKAIVVNRVGDFGLYFALLLLIYIFKSVNFGVIFSSCYLYENAVINIFGYDIGILTIIASCIFLGTMGKSAQIGLHMWLPDAMEGPTPVSALLHAATMVTAGVFVLLRFSMLFEFVPKVLFFVTMIGCATSLFAGLAAVLQSDIKKIIAYSTCSHLGIMLIACGLSQYNIALFHLFNHAFFKALLFLGAGAVIHSLNDEQDSRKMGGLLVQLPFTYTMFLVGSLSLSGFPFLSGFFSKDLIWEVVFTKAKFCGLSPWGADSFMDFVPILYYKYLSVIFVLILVFSTLYSFRLLFQVFYYRYNGYKVNVLSVHEPSLFMFLPLFILVFFSVFSGYLAKDLFVGLGVSNWTSVFPSSFVTLDGFREMLFVPEAARTFVQYLQRFFTFGLSVFVICCISYNYSRLYSSYWHPNLDFFVWYSRSLLGSVSCMFTSLFFIRKSRMVSVFLGICLWGFSIFFFHFFMLISWYSSFTITLIGLLFFIEFSTSFFFNILNDRFSSFRKKVASFEFGEITKSFSLYKRAYSLFTSDHIVYQWICKFFFFISYHITFKSIDRGFLELVGPFGIVNTLRKFTIRLSFHLNNNFFSFIFSCLYFIFLLLFFWFFFNEEELIFVVFIFISYSLLADKRN